MTFDNLDSVPLIDGSVSIEQTHFSVGMRGYTVELQWGLRL